jgi:sugar/nucleoside kinase (ribokinase family)
LWSSWVTRPRPSSRVTRISTPSNLANLRRPLKKAGYGPEEVPAKGNWSLLRGPEFWSHGLVAQFDVPSVGDTATDAFIRLSDAHVRIQQDGHGQWMDLPFGGKVPFDYAVMVDAGGNAANGAVGFARLGLSTAIAAHVGNDDIGRMMQATLEHERVDTHLVRFDPDQPSNRNFVLWFGPDRTIPVRHQLADYHWAHLSPREVPRWLYVSSVGSDAPEYYDQIVAWLDTEPSVHFAFQPGTFQIAQGVEAMRGIYRRASVLICNRGEEVEIGGGDHGKVGEILDSLRHLGPEIVVITDGPDGAYSSDGSERYFVPRLPRSRPAQGAHGHRRRVCVCPRRRHGKRTPAAGGAVLGPRERHERGSGGRLPIGPAERKSAAQLPRGRPGGVRGHGLVSRTAGGRYARVNRCGTLRAKRTGI